MVLARTGDAAQISPKLEKVRAVRIIALISVGLMLAAGAANAAEKKGGATFVTLPTLTANAIRSDGRRGVLTVEAGIDAPDPATKALAEKSAPRLRDAYLTALTAVAQATPPGAPPDTDQISRNLQGATDRVLRRSGAHVLLGSVIVN